MCLNCIYYALSLSLSSIEIDSLQTRLSEGETDAQMRQRELTKTIKLNKKLRDELRSLNQHVADNMVSRVDFDYYKKLIDEKVISTLSETNCLWRHPFVHVARCACTSFTCMYMYMCVCVCLHPIWYMAHTDYRLHV